MKMREVCRRTGLTERTVRFYVEQGLLNPATDRMNGRTYLNFSEEDIAVLEDLATLRRAQFSIGEIAELQGDFSLLPAMLTGKAEALRADATEAEQYAAALEQLQPDTLTGLQSLAHALRHPIGSYDPTPRFGRFDPETARERDEAYEAFVQNSARREALRRRLLSAAAAVLLVLLSVFVTLWATDSLPKFEARTAAVPTSSMGQRYTEAQVPALDGCFRAWLAPSAGYSLQEAGLDAITGHLTLHYVNHANGSCVLTVECEPLDEMACALVDDQSLPLMTLLTHPETPEARVELIVPGVADSRYYAVYLRSESLSEDEIIDQFGTLYIRYPAGQGYVVDRDGSAALPDETPAYGAAQAVEELPAPAANQTLQRYRWGYWRDADPGTQSSGLYRLVSPDGSAAYYTLGDASADWPIE